MLNKMKRNLEIMGRVIPGRLPHGSSGSACLPSGVPACAAVAVVLGVPSVYPSFQANEYTNNREESERSNDYEKRERSTNATISRVSIPRPTTSSSFDSINSNRSFTYKERE